MKANEAKFLGFIEGRKQFIIPIYQRTYSWTLVHCEQLWNDIHRAATDQTVSAHFVGSIVYIQKGLYQATTVPLLQVIDGQQRLTTLTLLILALSRHVQGNGTGSTISSEKLNKLYLINDLEEGDLRFKLMLTQSDRDTLIRMLENQEVLKPSHRIMENFRFFQEKIKSDSFNSDVFYCGLSKLIIVDIALDRDHDNPQLIFESLNSMGLELSQADLIRNYVLMGLEPMEQEALYNEFWFPMEQSFGQANYVAHFDRFMRDYPTLKTGIIPNIREVYQAFKQPAQSGKWETIRDIVADIYKFSQHFVSIALEKETDGELRRIFHNINTLKVDVAYPFLLEAYNDWAEDRLGKAGFKACLRLVEGYVFRRSMCGIPTNSLNKTFAQLGKEIDKSQYFESLNAMFVQKDSYRRFPTDREFRHEITTKDMYHIKNRNYWLRKLENHERTKETVEVEEYTIEHIMPQNENLSDEWKQALGDNWKEVKTNYLNTLGNLTLTGYNTELSDRPFKEKRDMPKGFKDSPIRLNKDLANLDNWNEVEMVARSGRLADQAMKVWGYLEIAQEVLEQYKEDRKPKEGPTYNLADHQHLTGQMMELLELFRRRVMNFDDSVTEDILKLYIAFKLDTNIVDVVPQANRLQLTLNMKYEEINDPKGLCKDVSQIGRWGNGDIEVGLESLEHLDDVMFLVRQSFEYHSEIQGE